MADESASEVGAYDLPQTPDAVDEALAVEAEVDSYLGAQDYSTTSADELESLIASVKSDSGRARAAAAALIAQADEMDQEAATASLDVEGTLADQRALEAGEPIGSLPVLDPNDPATEFRQFARDGLAALLRERAANQDPSPEMPDTDANPAIDWGLVSRDQVEAVISSVKSGNPIPTVGVLDSDAVARRANLLLRRGPTDG